ncbi:core histone macro-H2A.2-like [Lampris incognitus]|uniref:core histone macro-H2A.2-like n=1 Tax=Lampris incognitus TaxID=2546036 RepID=UPI0024B4FD13|nr:core histone macro-H2A.2-like [Lampris incognitus]
MSAEGGKTKATRRSGSARAGVIFPVGRMMRYLRAETPRYRISMGAPVYIAAVVEYLTAEVLELAGKAARDNKRGRITPRHIKLAMATDDELNQLLQGVTISNGGVLPRIHPELFLEKRGGQVKVNAKVSLPEREERSNSMGSSVENYQEAVQNSTVEDGPGDGFTILSAKSLSLRQKLSLTESEISKIGTIKVEGIINPTNAEMDLKEGVGNALEKVGGQEFLERVKALREPQGPLDVASVAVSQASGMAACFVIHCNIPQWGSEECEDQLEKTVKNCLAAAEEKELKSVAFPSLPTGWNGFPQQTVAQLIIKAISNHFVSSTISSLKNIYIVVFDSESTEIYLREMAKLDTELGQDDDDGISPDDEPLNELSNRVKTQPQTEVPLMLSRTRTKRSKNSALEKLEPSRDSSNEPLIKINTRKSLSDKKISSNGRKTKPKDGSSDDVPVVKLIDEQHKPVKETLVSRSSATKRKRQDRKDGSSDDDVPLENKATKRCKKCHNPKEEEGQCFCEKGHHSCQSVT